MRLLKTGTTSVLFYLSTLDLKKLPMSLRTYSGKRKEGHADHAERGRQQASIPGLGNLVAIANGGESDLAER